MALLNRPHAYSRMEHEDPEETKHRRAQFLIYKTMQKGRRRPSWLGVRIVKLKIKIVGRFKKLRKDFSAALLMFSAKPDICKHVLRSCKHLLHGKQGDKARTLPPIF